jgi:putative hydrolase of the HAD superfamily
VTTPFRAVIFDIGGVLTTSPILAMRAFCEGNGVPWDAVRPPLGSHEGAWSRFETSAISQAEFVAAFETECAGVGHTIDGAGFLAGFFGGLRPRPDMLAVVRTLRTRMKAGCITNNVEGGSRRQLVALGDLFDVVIESSKVGMRKPDPAIYRLACDGLGVQPEQAIFLDDFGVNLKAARALGMATIKVDETQSAIDELEQLLGITLPRQAGELRV